MRVIEQTPERLVVEEGASTAYIIGAVGVAVGAGLAAIGWTQDRSWLFVVAGTAFALFGLRSLLTARTTTHRFERALGRIVIEAKGRLVLTTTKGAVAYVDFAYRPDDIILVGRESAGVPEEVHRAADARIVIPMQPGMRSLNVAVTAAMILGEALRQTNAFPLPVLPEI